MNNEAMSLNRRAGHVLAIIREMRKWGFSLVQSQCSKAAPIDDQIEQARIVARQLLGVEVDSVSDDIDWVAKGIIDVAASTRFDDDFVSRAPSFRLASVYIPYRSDIAPRGARLEATVQCNQRIMQDQLDVLNVETIYERGFFGRSRATGLLIWHRV